MTTPTTPAADAFDAWYEALPSMCMPEREFALFVWNAATARESALVAERDAYKLNAERYDKLKARLIGADFDWNESGTSVLAFEIPSGMRVSNDCDAMVDALAAPAVEGV